MKMKATLYGAVLLGLLAWSVPGFAEVQNVRVSGDVTLRAIFLDNLDLNDDRDGSDDIHYFLQTTGLNVGADLTENVSAFMRLTNERDWNRGAGESTSDFDLSQSYITMKELFYSPLTLRVGTQPLWFGRGFVVGSTLIPGVLLGGADPNGAIGSDQFTDFTAFDAIRATLDLSNMGGMSLPLTADIVYSKIDENSLGAADDVNLFGVNLGTKSDMMGGSEAEVYYWNKRDKGLGSSAGPAGGDDNNGSVNTIGLRGSVKPMETCLLYGELAYQFGTRTLDATGTLQAGDSQQAWGVDLGVEHTFADVAMTPKLAFEWIFYSGKDVDGAVNGWDPMFRGAFTTALREWASTGLYVTDQAGDTNSVTNQHQLAFTGAFKPIEDLTVTNRLTLIIQDEGAIPAAGSKRDRYVGTEWDAQLVYNYTEDVQFGFVYALLVPGSVYHAPNDATEQAVVSSVSVKF